MDTTRRNGFVQSWLTIQDTLAGSEPYEQNFWAHDELADLCESKPQDAWEVIVALVEAANSEPLLEAIGAGPLQDLMALHGEDYIARVEQEAAGNARFRRAMAGAWLDADDTPVWAMFYEIAGVEPPFPEEDE
jgi:hypothetical protein